MLSFSADKSEILCIICKENIDIKAFLPCSCFFCFNCINRHLKKKSFCPKCFTDKISFYDIICSEDKKRRVNKIIAKSEAMLKKELKKHGINCKGVMGQLRWRYNELLCILENERYRIKSKPSNKIAWEVHRKELSVFRSKKAKDLGKIKEKARKLRGKLIKKEFI